MSKTLIWGFSKLLKAAGVELKGAQRAGVALSEGERSISLWTAGPKPQLVTLTTSKSTLGGVTQEVIVGNKRIVNNTSNLGEGYTRSVGQIEESGTTVFGSVYTRGNGFQHLEANGKMMTDSGSVNIKNLELNS